MKTPKRLIRNILIGFVACAISLTACKKKKSDEAVDPDPDLTTERDLSNANNDQNSLLKDIDKALDNSTANLREEASSYFTTFENSCDTTIDSLNYKRFIQLTYTATADDGQSRSGELKIFSVGKRTTNDFKAYVTFTGAKIGGRTITGTKKIIQQDSTHANQWQFAIVANGTITTIDGRIISYSSNRTRTRTGISTLGNPIDDSFTITGSWSGTNGNGESVSANITSPLQLAYSCHVFREITSGNIDFINNTKGITRSIDYGSGGCDGKGTFINAKGRAFDFYFQR